MAIRKRKRTQQQDAAVAVVQTAKSSHPFASIAGAYAASSVQTQLYKSLRDAVPIIDAAIMKTVRLLGSFTVSTGSGRLDEQLLSALRQIGVGASGRGIDCFISSFFEQMLTYGTAVGEMIISPGGIAYLYNADLNDVRLENSENPLEVRVLCRGEGGMFTRVKYPRLILIGAHNPQPASAYGVSVLEGLSFLSDIFLKIMNTIGKNWERLGNVRFAVTYKPGEDELDRAYSKQRAAQVAKEWSKAMDPGGPVRDFVAVGDVKISAIGADNQILDSEVPVRQILEQIVAKLSIPPFLLGLNWSTTERMSSQQADILTSEIDAYRRELEPIIRRICQMQLSLMGQPCEFEIQWSDITLQDITELSRSELYRAQAEQIRKETEIAGD